MTRVDTLSVKSKVCASGGMVDTLALGASASGREGSSPFSRTKETIPECESRKSSFTPGIFSISAVPQSISAKFGTISNITPK